MGGQGKKVGEAVAGTEVRPGARPAMQRGRLGGSGAEVGRADHLAHAAHQRIAGVVVGERKDAAGLLDRRLHAPRFRERDRQRLVADDVDSGLDKGDRRPGVHVIRTDDRDRLDPVGPRRLRLRHARIVAVDAVGRKAERLAGAARLFRAR